jgi:Dolichyl-phosphate-mannose-protein mannosyltransferase
MALVSSSALSTNAAPVGRPRAGKFELLGAAILVLMAVNLVSVTVRKSITADEVGLIPAAYYHFAAPEIHLVAETPPLCKLLAGFPLLFIQPKTWTPPVDPLASPDQNEWSYFVHFWQANRADFETICFWSRLPMIALTLALGVLVFFFTRELFGPRAAVLAVALFAVEPTILAHGRIVQTDIPAACGFLLSVVAVYRYLHAPDWRKAAGVGAAVAIALLAKSSMLALVPALAVVLALLLVRQPMRLAKVGGHALIATIVHLLVINGTYLFHNRALTEGDLKWIADCFPSCRATITTSVRALRLILPTDFVMGIYWQLNHGQVGHQAGLLGMHSNHGWWYYFPVAFFFKATIPFLLLSVASIGWALHRVVRYRGGRWLALLVPFSFYTALVMTSPINIGIRYYLPAYVFLVILSACLLDSLLRHRKPGFSRVASLGTAMTALAWMWVEAGLVYPNYIPYLNQLASARPHWWYLSDSNVEWGDDAKDLVAFLHARGQNRVRGRLLGCFATLDFYRVEYIDALLATTTTETPPRYTAIGASALNGSTVPFYEHDGKRVSEEQRVNTFDAFRHRTPEAVIGNSIYVFRMGD